MYAVYHKCIKVSYAYMLSACWTGTLHKILPFTKFSEVFDDHLSSLTFFSFG